MISESYAQRIKDYIKDVIKNNDVMNSQKTLPADFVAMSAAAKLFTKSALMGMDGSVRHYEFEEIPNVDDIENLPFTEAVEYLKKRSVLSKVDYEKLSDKLRFRAFTASRIADGDLLKRINEQLIKNVDSGDGLKSFLSMTKDELLSKVGMGANQGWYWETVYRTNVQTAYNVGRAMAFEQDKPLAYELIAIDDNRTTDICRPYATKRVVLASDDPFWKTHWPPFHFNCRTTVRAIYDESELPEHFESVQDVPSAKGFGEYPLNTDSWWQELESQSARAKDYGIQEEILGAKNVLINKKEIKKIGNILKGAEMTFDEADGGRVNPFFDQTEIFSKNCQSCVAAFEARLRGFRVMAKSYDDTSVVFKRLARNPARAFIDPFTRTHPEWLKAPDFNDWKDGLNYVKKTVKRNQRYIMTFKWKDGDGHVISVIKPNKGSLFFYDPQDGNIYEREDFRYLFEHIDFSKEYFQPKLLRVDHLHLDENILKYVLEASYE